MVGSTAATHAAVVSSTLGRRTATAQARAIQAQRACHGTIAVVDALTAGARFGLAEPRQAFVARATVRGSRARRLTGAIEASAAGTALATESTLRRLCGERLTQAGQTAIARAAVRTGRALDGAGHSALAALATHATHGVPTRARAACGMAGGRGFAGGARRCARAAVRRG